MGLRKGDEVASKLNQVLKSSLDCHSKLKCTLNMYETPLEHKKSLLPATHQSPAVVNQMPLGSLKEGPQNKSTLPTAASRKWYSELILIKTYRINKHSFILHGLSFKEIQVGAYHYLLWERTKEYCDILIQCDV